MNPRELLLVTAKRFREAGVPDPETDGALLLSSLCGKPPLELRLDTETVLPGQVLADFDRLVSFRLRRMPLQYLLRETSFCGRSFHVDQRVLIPRPETELLCAWALEILEGRRNPRILDVCCGSGCIGLTLKAELPDAFIVLTDISSEALEVCRENASRLGVSAIFHCGDLLEDLPFPPFDLIVSNPPYIPCGECATLQPEVRMEPLLALDGGPDGLNYYRRLISQAPAFLSAGGTILVEMGENEAAAIDSLLRNNGFSSIHIRQDLSGTERMISAVLN